MPDLNYPAPSLFNAEITPLLGSYFFNELIGAVRVSKMSIYVVQYQWKWNVHERFSKVQMLGTEIINAQARKVDVRVILNQESPNRNLSKINAVTGDYLARAGCQVRNLRTTSLLHTKLWVIDCLYTFIGSHNISGRSLSVNEEYSVKITSKKFALFSIQYFKTLWDTR
jgi:phosphatidylserine/phosphatidylglycerophosphate/cardiolipin synthase-like enzyme